MNCFKKGGLFFGSILLLNACSSFHGYQAPAPVYGKPVTDPYARPYPASRHTQPVPDKTITHPIQSAPDVKQFQPVEIPKQPSRDQLNTGTMSPAVVALLSQSEKSSKSGQLDSAVVTLERALRIDPRNPMLTYKLAEVRLQQEKPRLAEDLAKKAALLAGKEYKLKYLSWTLISQARSKQGNRLGAIEAANKAKNYLNP